MIANRCLGCLLAWLLAGCAPALDWRELQPEGGGIRVLFPCKPEHQTRSVRLGADTVRLALHACSAAGSTWALAFAEVAEPGRVAQALDELAAASQRNLGAGAAVTLPLKVAGATPNPNSRRLQFAGRMPDGRPVVAQVAVFSKGLRIYQATVLGEKPDAEALDLFFDNLRLAP